MKHSWPIRMPDGSSLRTALLAGLLLAAPAGCRPAAAPSPPDLRVEVDVRPGTVLIGEPAEVRIRVVHPEGMRARFPELSDEAVEWRWTDRAETGPGPGPDVQTTRRALTLMSFTVGEHVLFENAAVTLVAADGGEFEAPVPETVLRVDSVLRQEGADMPRDLKDPVAWRGPLPAWVWAIPLIALLAALAGWIARRLLRRARRPRPEPPPPSPGDVALAALQRLHEGGAIEKGPAEPFYRELSAIVRRYIEDRFGLRAPEWTTEEFIREAAESGRLDEGQREHVRVFLVECDLVKFARYEPGQPERANAWHAAERLVHEGERGARDAEEARP